MNGPTLVFGAGDADAATDEERRIAGMALAAEQIDAHRARIRQLYEQIEAERAALKWPLTLLHREMQAHVEPTRWGNRKAVYGDWAVDDRMHERRYQLIDFSDNCETPILVYAREPRITVTRIAAAEDESVSA